jgi:F-type H+-transporting ATPase subunit epsilon
MAETPASTGSLKCIVVTPETTVLDVTATFVALPLFDGEVGIAPLHSPMIGRLGYGEMRIHQPSETTVYYVDGGFVQVADNVVSILTNRAVPAADLEADTARELLATALGRPAPTDELLAIRDRQIAQSRAQLHIANKAK